MTSKFEASAHENQRKHEKHEAQRRAGYKVSSPNKRAMLTSLLDQMGVAYKVQEHVVSVAGTDEASLHEAFMQVM